MANDDALGWQAQILAQGALIAFMLADRLNQEADPQSVALAWKLEAIERLRAFTPRHPDPVQSDHFAQLAEEHLERLIANAAAMAHS